MTFTLAAANQKAKCNCAYHFYTVDDGASITVYRYENCYVIKTGYTWTFATKMKTYYHFYGEVYRDVPK